MVYPFDATFAGYGFQQADVAGGVCFQQVGILFCYSLKSEHGRRAYV